MTKRINFGSLVTGSPMPPRMDRDPRAERLNRIILKRGLATGHEPRRRRTYTASATGNWVFPVRELAGPGFFSPWPKEFAEYFADHFLGRLSGERGLVEKTVGDLLAGALVAHGEFEVDQVGFKIPRPTIFVADNRVDPFGFHREVAARRVVAELLKFSDDLFVEAVIVSEAMFDVKVPIMREVDDLSSGGGRAAGKADEANHDEYNGAKDKLHARRKLEHRWFVLVSVPEALRPPIETGSRSGSEGGAAKRNGRKGVRLAVEVSVEEILQVLLFTRPRCRLAEFR